MRRTTLGYAKHGVAFAAIVACYGWARPPKLPEAEAQSMSRRFRFERYPLTGEAVEPSGRKVRAVHPALKGIAAWISSVGASVALNDLDGDGLPNDVCLVDVRTDEVVIAPVPGSKPRYQRFVLASDDRHLVATAPMGCMPGDYNEDGLRDLLVYYWGRSPLLFLRTDTTPGLGQASYLTRELVDPAQVWNTNAATQADVDGDGHVDLIFGNYFRDNDRILDPAAVDSVEMHNSMANANNGGRNRLLLWRAPSRGTQPGAVFEEMQGVWPEDVARGWTLAVGAADIDGDGLPELYFANDFGPDRLLYNKSTPGKVAFTVLEGRRTFTTPKSKVLGRDSFKGMGVDFGDINGDGTLDIFVSNIAASFALEESHFLWESEGGRELTRARIKDGYAPYRDNSESRGLARSNWSWEARLDDFDNDGVLEAVQATGFLSGGTSRWADLQELAMANDLLLRHPAMWPGFQVGDDLSGNSANAFFVRARDGRYHDIAGNLDLGTSTLTRGIATGDVDGDGDLDIALANQWNTSLFHRNTATTANSFVGLHLMHPCDQDAAFVVRPGHPVDLGKSWPAIGAEAQVSLPDGRVVVAQVDGGNGHSGRRSPDIHFGLGPGRPTSVPVIVQWRDRGGQLRVSRFNVEPGWHTVVLGRAKS